MNSEFSQLKSAISKGKWVDTDDICFLQPKSKVFGSNKPILLDLGKLSVSDQLDIIGIDPIHNSSLYYSYENDFYNKYKDHFYKIGKFFEQAKADCRQIGEIFYNIKIADWEIWKKEKSEIDIDQFIISPENKCLIIDLGSFNDIKQKNVVMKYVISYLWENRRRKKPYLLFIDEAHNVCPPISTDEVIMKTTDILISIAGEGRKFGLWLLLCSQQPSKIHDNVLSLCNNLILLQTTSSLDLDFIYKKFSQIPDTFIKKARFFDRGEALIAGKFVPTPIFMRFLHH